MGLNHGIAIGFLNVTYQFLLIALRCSHSSSNNLTKEKVEENREFMLNPIDAARPTPYYFGLDPVSGQLDEIFREKYLVNVD